MARLWRSLRRCLVPIGRPALAVPRCFSGSGVAARGRRPPATDGRRNGQGWPGLLRALMEGGQSGRALRRQRSHPVSECADSESGRREMPPFGAQRRLGSITKAGSTHARRLLVEAGYHYRRGPVVGEALERRQRGHAPEIINISWKAQRRLNARWRQLRDARRKPNRDRRGRDRPRARPLLLGDRDLHHHPPRNRHPR